MSRARWAFRPRRRKLGDYPFKTRIGQNRKKTRAETQRRREKPELKIGFLKIISFSAPLRLCVLLASRTREKSPAQAT
jgi:hypothetical protein